jgi:CBS domain-containing protein
LIILQQIATIIYMTEISDYITNDYKAISSQETIESVQDFFSDVSYSHFPVVEEGIFIECFKR